ncbi:hypothetical protein [Sphingomonas phyllosphaerae]|uniref:hypothetical protein n=1 Tax=Sphingomonas phyllosphaerae TaxID=257003 RepID=UPI0004151CBA|nr:hypothetical protein [Sphingomonas phyllosphaerae]
MKWLLCALALTSGASLSARDLVVPADKGWKHAETGIILSPQLAGLPRTDLTDATQSEHDVTAQFAAADGSVSATIYIFHPAIPDAGIWFDRARATLESRDMFRSAAPATADPVSFTAYGNGAANALRQDYAIAGGPFRSTALVVVPVGEWIATIRMTARALTSQQLDTQLLDMVKAIRWPIPTGTAAASIAPVKPCTAPLTFKKAKQVKPNGSDLLLSLIGGAVARSKEGDKDSPPRPRVAWCRDGAGTPDYGVYRADDERSGYSLALHDAGRVMNVAPSLMGQVEKTGAYSVTLVDVDGKVSALPSFAAMPTPRQVWDLLGSGKTLGTAKSGQVTLDPSAL